MRIRRSSHSILELSVAPLSVQHFSVNRQSSVSPMFKITHGWFWTYEKQKFIFGSKMSWYWTLKLQILMDHQYPTFNTFWNTGAGIKLSLDELRTSWSCWMNVLWNDTSNGKPDYLYTIKLEHLEGNLSHVPDRDLIQSCWATWTTCRQR